MTRAMLTTRGRVTIPAEIRLAMKAEAGDRIEFIETAPGCFRIRNIRSKLGNVKAVSLKSKPL